MHRIAGLLPWRLKTFMIKRFLINKGIQFDGIPWFDGIWPNIINNGRMTTGSKCHFRSFRLRQQIEVYKNAELILGDNVFLNDGVNICATKSIKIGHFSGCGDMTYIYDTGFHQVTPDIPMKQAPVSIGNNVWIGAMSIILPGAVIGDHSVIAAGSVVTGEIPEKTMAAGAPARPIKTLTVPDGWARLRIQVP